MTTGTTPVEPTNGTLATKVIVVTGATSPSGEATIKAFLATSARVIAVSIDTERLGELAEAFPAIHTIECDLTDFAAVTELRQSVIDQYGGCDGVVHLVGGWRGAPSFPSQSDEDWDFLNRVVFGTLRNTSRAFFDDLVASDSGRFVMITANASEKPTAGGASYASAKAASEAWTKAMAHGFATRQKATTEQFPDGQALRAAAVQLAIKALVDDSMKAASPDKKFPGFTHVTELAKQIVSLFGSEPESINGERIKLGQ